MAEPFTDYWKPDEGFENIPHWRDEKVFLMRFIRECDAVSGYPQFRTQQIQGRRYPRNSALICCQGGERLPVESFWLQGVPNEVLDRLEHSVNGYQWLIPYLVENKTGNPNSNPNHEYDWEDELVSVGGKVLPDDTVWLYHATKREIANEILKTGILKTAHGAPKEYGIYFGSNSSVGFDYGDGTVIPVRVKAENLHPDDIFPERRMDFMIKAREYRPVEIGKPFNVRETNSAHNSNDNPSNPHNNPNHNEDDVWQQRDATQERILDRLKLKESGVKIDEPPLLVTVGATHTVVGEVDGLKLNFALGEIAQGDTSLFDTFRIRDRLWHIKKSIALSTLKGRQKARDKREGKQMKMYEEWDGLAKFEKKEEEFEKAYPHLYSRFVFFRDLFGNLYPKIKQFVRIKIEEERVGLGAAVQPRNKHVDILINRQGADRLERGTEEELDGTLFHEFVHILGSFETLLCREEAALIDASEFPDWELCRKNVPKTIEDLNKRLEEIKKATQRLLKKRDNHIPLEEINIALLDADFYITKLSNQFNAPKPKFGDDYVGTCIEVITGILCHDRSPDPICHDILKRTLIINSVLIKDFKEPVILYGAFLNRLLAEDKEKWLPYFKYIIAHEFKHYLQYLNKESFSESEAIEFGLDYGGIDSIEKAMEYTTEYLKRVREHCAKASAMPLTEPDKEEYKAKKVVKPEISLIKEMPKLSPKIPPELEPLLKKARQYETAEDFNKWWNKAIQDPSLSRLLSSFKNAIEEASFTKEGLFDSEAFWGVAHEIERIYRKLDALLQETLRGYKLTEEAIHGEAEAWKYDLEEIAKEVAEGRRTQEDAERWLKEQLKLWKEPVEVVKPPYFKPVKVFEPTEPVSLMEVPEPLREFTVPEGILITDITYKEERRRATRLFLTHCWGEIVTYGLSKFFKLHPEFGVLYCTRELEKQFVQVAYEMMQRKYKGKHLYEWVISEAPAAKATLMGVIGTGIHDDTFQKGFIKHHYPAHIEEAAKMLKPTITATEFMNIFKEEVPKIRW